MTEVDYQCRGDHCDIRMHCRRTQMCHSNLPYAAFDQRRECLVMHPSDTRKPYCQHFMPIQATTIPQAGKRITLAMQTCPHWSSQK